MQIKSSFLRATLFFLCASPLLCSGEVKKKLIEFGWDEPDPAFMRKHVAEMEKTPFDGCVFHLNYISTNGSTGSFTWEGWGKRAFTEAELKTALEDYRATPFRRLTNNFARFNVTPENVDWFDDFSAITNNARLVAWFSQQAGCKGVLFDIEHYNAPIFQYRTRRDAAKKSWEVYAKQAHKRGREVMEAFQKGSPDGTIFLTFGYSLPWAGSGSGRKSLADGNYGLLAPFLDGMVEVAKPHQIVEGAETAYAFRDPAQFAVHYKTLKTNLLSIVNDAEKYQQVMSIGFGIWLDNDWRNKGWSATDVTTNFYTPPIFEASVRKALEVADEYVWIYTEKPRWWTEQGKSELLPQAYIDALQRAKGE